MGGRYPFKTLDELLDDDEDGPFGKPRFMQISEDKEIDIALRAQLGEDAQFQVEQEHNALVRRKREEERLAEEAKRMAEEAERRAEEELHRKVEQERQRHEEEIRLSEQIRLREDDERIAQTGQLRQAHHHIIPDLTEAWVQKARSTLKARDTTEMAKTAEGTPLLRKDFATVVPPNQWLNDEIINGTLSHVNNYINQSAGIKNVRVQTPKSQLFNSFAATGLAGGKKISDRMMRRLNVKKENFLEIETIFMPICRSSHWTLLVIRPKHRQICHLDSMNPGGSADIRAKGLSFVKDVLSTDFHENEWTTLTAVRSPRQSNCDDCGVHVITNGICMGLGIDPTSAYDTAMMPMQRLRVASVLLNGGFKGDLTLDEF